MTKSFWRVVAFIVCLPPVTRWLIASAQKRPYSHIGEYMSRWWLIPPSRFFPMRVRVHHIRLPDADPVLHSHPLDFRSILLRGYYVNENAYGEQLWFEEGDTWRGSKETLHRLAAVSAGGVWTLFIFFGNEKSRWGFMAGNPPRLVDYRQYVSTNDPLRVDHSRPEG